MKDGWPDTIPAEYQPYCNCRMELSTEGHCILWGNRVGISLKLIKELTEELHTDHPGLFKMKSMARSDVVTGVGPQCGNMCKCLTSMPGSTELTC